MLAVLFYLFIYLYLELGSDKSTEIKTPFLGLEPHDITVIVYVYNQENLGKFCFFYADEICDGQWVQFKFVGIKVCGHLISRFYSIREN